MKASRMREFSKAKNCSGKNDALGKDTTMTLLRPAWSRTAARGRQPSSAMIFLMFPAVGDIACKLFALAKAFSTVLATAKL